VTELVRPGLPAVANGHTEVIFDRIESDRIITVNGQIGVFTPVSKTKVDVNEKNLTQIVNVLRDRVTVLEGENAKLQDQLKQTQLVGRSADEVSTALGAALDLMQTRFGEAKTGQTAFAVREFHLDAAVSVDVNALGAVIFRFPLPGQEVDPSHISRMQLTIVPVPRSDDSPAPPPATTDRLDTTLDRLPGITASDRARLNEVGIFNVRDLVGVVNRSRVALHLQSALGVERQQLARWSAEAELVTLDGITGRDAHVLVAAGITGLASLAGADPARLTKAYNAAARKLRGLGAKKVDLGRITEWIGRANLVKGPPRL
jgi:predicted flap endonuclease-1-like 5' DNA nuclease